MMIYGDLKGLIWIHDLKGFMKISHGGTIGFGQQKLR